MTNQNTSRWTDEAVEILREGWVNGQSAKEIGAKIKAAGQGVFSRNAVIGKVHRIGLAGRATPQKPRARRLDQAKRPARMVFRTIPAEQRPAPYIPSAEPLLPTVAGVLDLERHHCRHPMDPIDGREGFSFCGRDREPGAQYCRHHLAGNLQAPPKAKKPARSISVKSVAGGAWGNG